MSNRAMGWEGSNCFTRERGTLRSSMFFGLCILIVRDSLDYKKVRFSFSLLFVC